MAEKRENQEEGQNLPIRRQERALSPFEPGVFESPFRAIQRLHNEIDRMFSGYGFPAWRTPETAPFESLMTQLPAMDVWETDQDVIVRADIPGVDPDNIEIYTTEDSLRIQAEITKEEEKTERGYYRAERRYGRFERLIDLPAEVKPQNAKATFNNGVLEVRLPKTQQAKERMKKVPVEVQQKQQMAGTKGGQTGETQSTQAKSTPQQQQQKKKK